MKGVKRFMIETIGAFTIILIMIYGFCKLFGIMINEFEEWKEWKE